MKITPIKIEGKEERGYTAEYDQERSGKQLILFRKAGTVSGKHFHKGISMTKNPEILLLLSGICTVNWKNVDRNEISSQKIEAPVRLEIPAYTWHELITETDCVFIEMNSLSEHQADTFYKK